MSARERKSEACPMTGKHGTCPVSGMFSGGSSPKKKDPFAKGSKSLITAGNDNEEKSLLWMLCPVHWNIGTLKWMIIIGSLGGVAYTFWRGSTSIGGLSGEA